MKTIKLHRIIAMILPMTLLGVTGLSLADNNNCKLLNEPSFQQACRFVSTPSGPTLFFYECPSNHNIIAIFNESCAPTATSQGQGLIAGNYALQCDANSRVGQAMWVKQSDGNKYLCSLITPTTSTK